MSSNLTASANTRSTCRAGNRWIGSYLDPLMPFLRVMVDEKVIASVDTSDVDIVMIRVGGTLVDEDYADISVSAGTYPAEGQSDHRTWIDQLPVAKGQAIHVALQETGGGVGKGRTFEELYPDAPTSSPCPTDIEDLAAEMRVTPKLRAEYVLRFTSTTGEENTYSTTPDDFGFGFNVLWNKMHPERASVLLACYSIDSFVAQQPGRTLLNEHMMVGSQVSLKLVA